MGWWPDPTHAEFLVQDAGHSLRLGHFSDDQMFLRIQLRARYPAHMLLALERPKPEDILAAREILQVTPDALDCFSPPRDPARSLPSSGGQRR